MATEEQITDAPHGHILLNSSVWSPDSKWIVYDTRSDPGGEVFDGGRIERVHIETREVQVLHTAQNKAQCGVVAYHPTEPRIAFIRGPEHPERDGWTYGPSRRQGVWLDVRTPSDWHPLDARDLSPPFTPGALRGGTHVHVWSPDGTRVASTYEDEWLNRASEPGASKNQRNVAVSLWNQAVRVPSTHGRNHNGTTFTVLATRTTDHPKPGSDDIQRACEEAWIGTHGYVRKDGTRQKSALAFQGQVIFANGLAGYEVFVADLPDDLLAPDRSPLAGSRTSRPNPPLGTSQRRITFTHDRKHPGLLGPRHWLQSAPDGSQIGCLMKDDAGKAQLWLVSPNGGAPRQLTHGPGEVESVFSWSPDGREIALIRAGAVVTVRTQDGSVIEWAPQDPTKHPPRPESCVFSPDGRHVAYVRQVPRGTTVWNQIFVASRK